MTPQDLQRIRASAVWREHRIEVFHDTSQGSVMVKGQRPANAVWRHHLMNLIAGILRVPMLATDPSAHGARAQQIEVNRLRSLAAAGVAVPAVLHVDEECFVMQFMPGRQLTELLQGEQAVVWWHRGQRMLVGVHQRGQYLSQAFARNFIANDETTVAIDFEVDPLQVMPLDVAQARDWMAYLYSSMKALSLDDAQAAAMLRAALADEPAAVRQQLRVAARRMAWVLRVRGESRPKTWRRHVSTMHAVVRPLLMALDGDDFRDANDTKSENHARHH